MASVVESALKAVLDGLGSVKGVVQVRVTPKTRKPFTIKALSISGVTWKWHVLNHAQIQVGGGDELRGWTWDMM